MQASNSSSPHGDNKPFLLKGVEGILAKPERIQQWVLKLEVRYFKKFKHAYSNDSNGSGNGGGNGKSGGPCGDGGDYDEIGERIAVHIVAKYARLAALVGITSSLPGIVPVVGTAVAIADGVGEVVLTTKLEVEMVMALAALYGYDITNREVQYLCYGIVGLVQINEAAKKGGTSAATKVSAKMVKEHLKGPGLKVVKDMFKMVGVDFTKKGLLKAIPLGIGTTIGGASNYFFTIALGNRAKKQLRPAYGM